MCNCLFSWFTPARPRRAGIDYPAPVTVTVARFPADGSAPHLVQVRTTHRGIDKGTLGFLFHAPDLRPYWNEPAADLWKCADLHRLDLHIADGNQGIYYWLYKFYEGPDCCLKDNVYRPGLYGDIFIVKMKPEQYGMYGWAAYDDVPAEFLRMPGLSTLLANIN